MKLLLDIGNTSIAWASKQDDQFIQTDRLYYDSAESIEKQIHHQFSSYAEPAAVLISSVLSTKQTEIVVDWFKSNWQCTVWQAASGSEFVDLKNSYINPEQMGVDRWLNMIAARAECKHRLCIIDCGTAMTIDIVGADGQHEGGLILPGLKTLQQALISGTNRIQVETLTNGKLEPANNTQAAISNGAMINMVASIEFVINRFNKNDEKFTCLVTGGDALQVIKNLSVAHEHRPMLVFSGLTRLYEASI